MANISDSSLIKNNESIHIKNALVVLVKTEWNAAIVNELENGCIHTLHQHGVKTKTLVVPGAIEIAFAIQHFFNNAKVPPNPQQVSTSFISFISSPFTLANKWRGSFFILHSRKAAQES